LIYTLFTQSSFFVSKIAQDLFTHSKLNSSTSCSSEKISFSSELFHQSNAKKFIKASFKYHSFKKSSTETLFFLLDNFDLSSFKISGKCQNFGTSSQRALKIRICFGVFDMWSSHLSTCVIHIS